MINIDKPIEFYTDPWGKVNIKQGDQTNQLTISNYTWLIDQMHDEIENDYPKAHQCLTTMFPDLQYNKPRLKMRIVERFIKCNFGRFDAVPDIDFKGRFHLERVICPLRGGACPYEGIICMPEYRTALSPKETQVVKLFCAGLNTGDIAANLDIQPNTVDKHIKNSFMRTGTHSRSELVIWAFEHQLIAQ